MADSNPRLRYADVAVTYTADQFQGIYRGKQYHAPDFDQVLKRAQAHNCEKIMLTTMNLAGAHANLEVVQAHPAMCTMTLGVHPYHADELFTTATTEQPLTPNQDYLTTLTTLAQTLLAQTPSPLVAFGEIGLDYSYLDRANKATQQAAFSLQLELAATQFPQLPFFLHVRESCDDVIRLIEPYLPRLPKGGLVHSFTGTRDEMQRLVDLGLGISVNGVSFRTDEGLEMVRAIPLDRLQLETDAPWCEVLEGDERVKKYLVGATELPASRKHGRFVAGLMVKGRNESCAIERVARVVAGVKGLGLEVVARAAWRNSVAMFGLGVEEGGVEGE
ncbi:TatD family hydrolase [Aspergillus homomorphus CBS 101889]|uniref:Mg-dependent DNase n=1 Tax=Aspergillus homomorphus (strain CBS 101889) TaxID=1450537 RepID=A0A395ICE4_ASPHC|nr:Mg-dependent DNase [Aspergillus homomorphus CBS 101889]RAL16778.1 Mg-dependent DNase [Aspergillus homomorphus CBS 101889]